MFVLDDAILAAVMEAVVGILLGKGLQLLSGDPQKRAFKAALREAAQDFDREHGDWSASLFDSTFLRTMAAPILAGALLRDPQPGAASLAAAWANQFPVAASSDPQRLNEAVSIAAEFLVIFDLALRRQDVFRPHFDSQAIDASARYLSELLRYARSSWLDDRRDRVNGALRMLVGAAVRYREAARARSAGSQLDVARTILDATIALEEADFLLARLQYSDADRLRDRFKELIEDPYEEGVNFDEGIEEYKRVIRAAPPL